MKVSIGVMYSITQDKINLNKDVQEVNKVLMQRTTPLDINVLKYSLIVYSTTLKESYHIHFRNDINGTITKAAQAAGQKSLKCCNCKQNTF